MTWTVVVLLAAGTWLLKAVGPVFVGGRELPPRVAAATGLLPPALLAALVVTGTLADGASLVLDARLAGVVVAGVAIWRGAPFLVVVGAATVTAALVRALT